MAIGLALASDVSGVEAVELLLMAISKSDQLNSYSREEVALNVTSQLVRHSRLLEWQRAAGVR